LGREKVVWGVVSVNFSGSFVRGVLDASVGAMSDGVEILANESNEDGVLVGPPMRNGTVMATSDAKLASMKELLKSWSDRTLYDGSRAVYIGDSGTDIECLMEKDMIGIAMSDDGKSSLIQTMLRIGVDVRPVQTWRQNEAGKSIYTARDFEELLQSPLFC
jgi:hypothetical protein